MTATNDIENTGDSNAVSVESTALLAEVMDYRRGRKQYDFSHLSEQERGMAAIEGWEDLELRIEQFLSANAKEQEPR